MFAESMGLLRHFFSNFHCVGLITNCTIPNSSRILTGSPSVQLGKDSLSPMERAVSCVFHDCCNSNAVLEIGNYLNDEHICFAGRKGCMVLDIKVELQVKLHFVSE